MNKYSAQKSHVFGIDFASKREANRYLILRAMQADGSITDLELQPRYDLIVNSVKIGRYTGDFRYRLPDGSVVVEDCKSPATKKARDYPLRKKLMLALHGVEILET